MDKVLLFFSFIEIIVFLIITLEYSIFLNTNSFMSNNQETLNSPIASIAEDIVMIDSPELMPVSPL